MIAESEREQSEFNMAVSYLNRLNNLFYLANNAAIERNADMWLQALNALYRELSTEMKQDEIETWIKVQVDLNFELKKDQKRMGRRGEYGLTTELYNRMQRYELFLRKIMKDSGLQNRMKTNAGLAMY